MNKLRMAVGLSIVAIAVTALNASAASALNVFLLNGGAIAEGSNVPVSVTGELLFEDMGAVGTPDVLCSMIFDGKLSSGKSGTVAEMLTLAGVANSNLVECTEDKGTCSNPVDVTATNFPWILVADFSDPEKKEGNEPRIVIDCNTIVGLVEDTCTGPIGGKITNEPTGVLVTVEEESAVPAMNCTQGGVGQGLVAGTLFMTSSSGTLSTS